MDESSKTPAAIGYRMPAEWKPHAATWLSWPRREGISFPESFDCVLPALRAMVEALNREFLHQTKHIQLRYSNALAVADLSRAELLHPIDGWHASVEGHNVLADAAFSDLKPSLDFLGIR